MIAPEKEIDCAHVVRLARRAPYRSGRDHWFWLESHDEGCAVGAVVFQTTDEAVIEIRLSYRSPYKVGEKVRLIFE